MSLKLKQIFLPAFCLVFLTAHFLQGQDTAGYKIDPPFLKYTHSAWVDSIMNTLSSEERIAQLIMVAAYSNRDKAWEDSISTLIENRKIGGLVFFQGGPVRQARLANHYQAVSDVPLLIAMDGEWGLGMRLDSTISFPYQMALGAVQNEDLVYAMGAEIGRQFKRMGVHINFAPVIDVNNNAANPVINYRSFGEEKYNVSRKGLAYMKGLQDKHILAVAKHFPGHGDTDVDSHLALPVINHSRARLDSVELYPFQQLIDNGLGGMMIAHLSIPALDTTKNQASTLSKSIVTGLLKDEMDFKGLIFTDAMNMKGVADYYPPGIADSKALLAGNDVIEFPRDAGKAIGEIINLVKSGEISQEEINIRCRKVLALKQWVGLNDYQPIEVAHLVEDLNAPSAQLLNRNLAKEALTVLKNEKNILPLQRLDTLNIASISIGVNEVSDFQRMLSNYTEVDHYFLSASSTEEMVRIFKEGLKKYNLIITGIHDSGIRPNNNVQISQSTENFIAELAASEKSIIALFRNAYVLDKYPGLEETDGLLVTYYDSKLTQELAAQLIFGGVGAAGKLPVTANKNFEAGDGLKIEGGQRFNFTMPEDAGMDANTLTSIDSLMQEAIEKKAIPGGVVVVAKDGKVVYNKAFGYHTYDSVQQVNPSDIYDFASISKVTTVLPALMQLHDQGRLELDATLGEYMPYFKRSDKADLTFREILAHYARLQPWIPYWKSTLRKNGNFKWFTFKSDSSKRFPIKVTDELFLHRRYMKKIYKAIKKSPLNEKKEYVYSGLSFYLFPCLIENITGQDYETYLKQRFYHPLGAYTLTFNPHLFYPLDRIVPTEYDSLFRKVQIHGRVHDEGAAMMGGISGNAGLFGKAIDLAKLMQMYLQKGTYAGQQYIADSTMNEFISCQYCGEGNRRGLGFDKPAIEYVENGHTAKDVSPSSFGHSGYTGTLTWVDPKYNLVYVFLSNRVYPTRENTVLYKLNTRTDIQQVIYDAIHEGRQLKEEVLIKLPD